MASESNRFMPGISDDAPAGPDDPSVTDRIGFQGSDPLLCHVRFAGPELWRAAGRVRRVGAATDMETREHGLACMLVPSEGKMQRQDASAWLAPRWPSEAAACRAEERFGGQWPGEQPDGVVEALSSRQVLRPVSTGNQSSTRAQFVSQFTSIETIYQYLCSTE